MRGRPRGKALQSSLRARNDRFGVKTVRGCGRSSIPATSLKGECVGLREVDSCKERCEAVLIAGDLKR